MALMAQAPMQAVTAAPLAQPAVMQTAPLVAPLAQAMPMQQQMPPPPQMMAAPTPTAGVPVPYAYKKKEKQPECCLIC